MSNRLQEKKVSLNLCIKLKCKSETFKKIKAERILCLHF